MDPIWLTTIATVAVAFATVLLAIFNCKLLKKYDRQYELDKFLIYRPLQENLIARLKKQVNSLDLLQK